MSSFWNIIRKIMNGLESRDVPGILEFNLNASDTEEAIVTFHTNDDGRVVMSVFDSDQWSLIEDMSVFAEKPVEDIVKELDPSGPNIWVIDPDVIRGSDDDDDDIF